MGNSVRSIAKRCCVRLGLCRGVPCTLSELDPLKRLRPLAGLDGLAGTRSWRGARGEGGREANPASRPVTGARRGIILMVGQCRQPGNSVADVARGPGNQPHCDDTRCCRRCRSAPAPLKGSEAAASPRSRLPRAPEHERALGELRELLLVLPDEEVHRPPHLLVAREPEVLRVAEEGLREGEGPRLRVGDDVHTPLHKVIWRLEPYHLALQRLRRDVLQPRLQ
eukprot:gene4608-biopygen11729